MGTYKDYVIRCTTCGSRSSMAVPVEESGPREGLPLKSIAKCPKCSKSAIVLDPWSQVTVSDFLAKEIAALRMAIFDLECQVEACVCPEDIER